MLFNYLLLSVFFFSSSTQVHLPLLYLCYRLLCTKKTAGHTPGGQYIFFNVFMCAYALRLHVYYIYRLLFIYLVFTCKNLPRLEN